MYAIMIEITITNDTVWVMSISGYKSFINTRRIDPTTTVKINILFLLIFDESINKRFINCCPHFRCLAVEWIPYGINVNCISPGAVMTPALEKPYLKEKVPLWESLYPIKRLGYAEEFKGAIVYLASDASSFMVGHVMVIDGGYLLY